MAKVQAISCGSRPLVCPSTRPAPIASGFRQASPHKRRLHVGSHGCRLPAHLGTRLVPRAPVSRYFPWPQLPDQLPWTQTPEWSFMAPAATGYRLTPMAPGSGFPNARVASLVSAPMNPGSRAIPAPGQPRGPRPIHIDPGPRPTTTDRHWACPSEPRHQTGPYGPKHQVCPPADPGTRSACVRTSESLDKLTGKRLSLPKPVCED